MSQCSYTHDVSGDQFPDLSDEWRCPRDVVAGTDQCLFHLPLAHPEKSGAQSALLENIRDPSRASGPETRREALRFLGAEIPGIDLSHEVVQNTTTYPVDLREVTVDGPTDLSRARIEPAIRLDGASLQGPVRGEEARFEGGLHLTDAEITGSIDFRDAQFDHELVVSGSTIRGATRLLDSRIDGGFRGRGTTFCGTVVLHGATIDADVLLSDSYFGALANLERVRITDDTLFERARFTGGVRLRQARLDTELTFTDAVIDGTATFTEAAFGGDSDFRTVRFTGKADFARATFCDVAFSNASFGAPVRFDRFTAARLDFDRCDFAAEASLQAATVTEGASFDGMSPGAVMSFDAAHFAGTISMTDLTIDSERPRFSFRQASLDRGTLAPGTNRSVVFDFEQATIGDVTLQTNSTTDSQTPFDQYRFLRTEFDGFDFSDYNSELKAAGWRLHSSWSGYRHQPDFSEPSYDDLEKTYLKAKNGAEEVGATQAEAEFFRKQLVYRRSGYGRRLRDEPQYRTVGLFVRWLSNWTFNLTSGYGERPRYTIATSVVTILVFAVAFWALLSQPPYGGTALDYLFLSVESYVSMIIGTPAIDSSLARVLAQLQGFLGGFLIALFIFTLTRSVYR